MSSCNHSKLVLLPEKNSRLRCRHCHLTIKADDIGKDYCPECFEASGKKRYEFEEIQLDEGNSTRYRCEDCHVIIES